MVQNKYLKKYNYNYVFFSGNKQEFYKQNHFDKNGDLVVRYYDGHLCKENRFLRFLYRIHNSGRLNRLIKLPFKKIWNKTYFHEKFANGKPICFVFSCELYFLKDRKYFEYLKRTYPNCKLVYFFTDMVDLVSKRFKDFNLDYLKKTFDFVMTYEVFDVKKYGLEYHYDVPPSFNSTEEMQNYDSDIVFVGEAKDRLETLLNCYDLFSKHNLKCDFTIVFAPKDIRAKYPNIKWLDSWMPYSVVLEKIKKSKCILDIVQNNAVGINARGFRAFQYNKMIVSNCKGIKYCSFFDGKIVQYFDNVNDIKLEPFFNKSSINYDYELINKMGGVNHIECLLSNICGTNEFYADFLDLNGLLSEVKV